MSQQRLELFVPELGQLTAQMAPDFADFGFEAHAAEGQPGEAGIMLVERPQAVDIHVEMLAFGLQFLAGEQQGSERPGPFRRIRGQRGNLSAESFSDLLCSFPVFEESRKVPAQRSAGSGAKIGCGFFHNWFMFDPGRGVLSRRFGDARN
jgi:hypothetical protein